MGLNLCVCVQKIGNLEINISLAKPPTENKKKEQRKRDQERRLMSRGGYGGSVLVF